MVCPRRLNTHAKVQHQVAGRSTSSRQRERRANMRLRHTAVHGLPPSTALHQEGSNRRGRAGGTATGAMPAAQSTADKTAWAPDMLRLSADMLGLITLRTRDGIASMVDG